MKLYVIAALYATAFAMAADFGPLLAAIQKELPGAGKSTEAKKEPKVGILGTLKSKGSAAVAKITGKTKFVSKDELFESLLDTFKGFAVMQNRVALVRSYGDLLKAMEGASSPAPILSTTHADYVPIKVLATARATTKDNIKFQAAHLKSHLEGMVKGKCRVARALWKYFALCAVKLTPMEEWHNKSLKEIFKSKWAAKMMKESGREDWFNVPITKSHIVFDLGKGKLPWVVEPRTGNDLVNGMLVLMSTSGRFETHASKKALTLGWEKACKLKEEVYREAIKDMLNLRYVNARHFEHTVLLERRAPLVREMMTLYAVNLEKLITEGKQTFK